MGRLLTNRPRISDRMRLWLASVWGKEGVGDVLYIAFSSPLTSCRKEEWKWVEELELQGSIRPLTTSSSTKYKDAVATRGT